MKKSPWRVYYKCRAFSGSYVAIEAKTEEEAIDHCKKEVVLAHSFIRGLTESEVEILKTESSKW